MSLASLKSCLAGSPRHVSPFLMLGDPTPDACVSLCRSLVAAGATMLELGMPYADPSADGPVVQAAGRRAMAAGVSTDESLETLSRIRQVCPDTPCNLLVYGNLVHARGYRRFCRDAVAAGASSLLVPDIPLEEGEPLRAACRAEGLGNVLLVGPRTPDARVAAIATEADAFVYLAGHQGITGAAAPLHEQRGALVRRVRALARVPLCVGFGLSQRSHIASVHEAGARVAVVGSHLLRVLEAALREQPNDPNHLQAAVCFAFQELLPAPARSKETPSCS